MRCNVHNQLSTDIYTSKLDLQHLLYRFKLTHFQVHATYEAARVHFEVRKYSSFEYVS